MAEAAALAGHLSTLPRAINPSSPTSGSRGNPAHCVFHTARMDYRKMKSSALEVVFRIIIWFIKANRVDCIGTYSVRRIVGRAVRGASIWVMVDARHGVEKWRRGVRWPSRGRWLQLNPENVPSIRLRWRNASARFFGKVSLVNEKE